MSAFRCDLHIHSCLSPCADEDMTPGTIAGVGKLNGLDILALTDHNSSLNVPAALAAGKAYGVEVIPGMEITTREEVHLLGIFPTLEQASAFQELIWNRLPDVPNHPEVFGEQILYDSSDRPIGTVKRLLLQSVMLGVEEVGTAIKVCGGLTIAAHVNRRSYSLIGQLAVVPEGLKLDAVEIDRSLSYRGFLEKFQELGCYPVLCSSDAHRLTDLVGSHRPRLFLDEASFAALEELLHSDDRSRIQFG